MTVWRVAVLAGLLVGCGDSGPWYDTEPDADLSYLPLGNDAYSQTEISWVDAEGDRTTFDSYLPAGDDAPIVVMLPGAFVVKERYRWLGASLASHGVATFVVQPEGDFTTSKDTLTTLAALEELRDDKGSALYRRIDVSRLILAGHSAGCVPQVGLTDVAACPPGFCAPGDETPRALRGLVLIGYHNQGDAGDDAPMAAVESPWLVLNGTRDGLATPEKVDATITRIIDRPLYRIDVVGANHFQMTDYVDPDVDLQLSKDLQPEVSSREARATAARYIVAFASRYLLEGSTVPADLGADGDGRVRTTIKPSRIVGPGKHGLPRVLSEPVAMHGLDGEDNASVTASAEFRGSRYLLVRNEEAGVEVWRMLPDGTLEQVPFPGGETNGFYGNRMLNGLLGDMVVFQNELWVAVSSGLQGAKRGSTAAELWAYDGAAWRPVVSNVADADRELVLTSVSGCAANDGDTTARFTFASAGFTPGSLAGAVLDDIQTTIAVHEPTVLLVVDNTDDTLVVQRDEIAQQDEDTTCEEIAAGKVFRLRVGPDESGFGQPWNKAITSLAVHDGKLYVATGLNYAHGGELYATKDGKTFEVVVPRSFFGKHKNGVPISSSISALHVSSVTGKPLLYAGTTGTEGYGARLFVVGDGAPRFLVDDSVDADHTGFDEAGFGGDSQQVVSMADFKGRLWIGTLGFSGLELYSTSDPADTAKSWRVEVGSGGRFDTGWGDESQIAARLFTVEGYLWVADVALIQLEKQLADKSAYTWRSADGERWQLVTAHGFGFNAVSVPNIFGFAGKLYAAAACGAESAHTTFGDLRLYELK